MASGATAGGAVRGREDRRDARVGRSTRSRPGAGARGRRLRRRRPPRRPATTPSSRCCWRRGPPSGWSCRTGVAIAFARTPMTHGDRSPTTCSWRRRAGSRSASAARSSRTSSGGSRCRGRTRRPRMREFILAMRAIWAAWNDGEKLDFRGEFYTHTLMTPFFDPGPNPFGPPEVILAAVGDLHDRGRGRGRRRHDPAPVHAPSATCARSRCRRSSAASRTPATSTRADFTLSLPVFVVTGTNDEEWDGRADRHQAADRVLRLDARLPRRARGSTAGTTSAPSSTSSRSKGEWVAMGELITDEMLETFAVVAAPDELAAGILARYGDVLDRLSFYAPYKSDPEVWTQAARADLRPPVDGPTPTRPCARRTRRSTPRSRRATSTPWPTSGSTPTASS